MNELNVTARPQAFNAPQHVGGIKHGLTLAEVVTEAQRRAHMPPGWHSPAIVQINGEVVPVSLWHVIRPKPAANVVITCSLHGGGGGGGKKNPIATVLAIAVMVAAPMVGSYAAWSAAASFSISTATFAAIEIGVGLAFAAAGSMLIGAVFPSRPPQLPSLGGGQSQQYNDSPTYSIGGARNRENKFGSVPVVLGKHKVTPPLGAKNYTEIVGNDEYLRMIVVWGYGPLKIENIKIGTTLLSEFDDVEIETREGRAGDAPITLYPGVVLQNRIGVTLVEASSWTIRTSEINADELSVDIAFPRGLTTFGASGARGNRTVEIAVEYRLIGAASWTAEHTFTITDATTSPLRFGHRWTVPTGQYQVRLRRVTLDDDSTSIVDTVAWSVLRTFRDESPINFRQPLAVSAIRIKASEQLQGAIDDLNATVTSYASVWNGSDWSTESTTQNPASLARLVLTGPANDRRVLPSRLDATFADLYDFCETNGYKFNMVRDFKSSAWDTLADIMSACRAAPAIIDGKWGAIMDYAGKPITQHFTPRNSWGFESLRSPMIMPHAWRAKFINENEDYNQDERIVYDDGYDADTATKFEGIEFPGVTDPDLVWKFGRYHIAQARLRPEEHSLNTDFEHLACTRGDVIAVAHDVTLWGSSWGRVKSLVTSGADTTGLVLDDEMVFETGKNYNVRFRLEDGSSLVAAVTNPGAGAYKSVTLTTPILTVDGPQPDDLAMFGEVGQETSRLIVKSIQRSEDLSASILCVDEAPAIYSADTGAIPSFTSNITSPIDVTRLKPAAPTIENVESGTAALLQVGSNFVSQIVVSLSATGGALSIAENRMRWRRQGSYTWEYSIAPVDQGGVILSNVIDGEVYEFQAAALSEFGVLSDWGPLTTETVLGQGELPNDVTGFAVNIVGTDAHLSWAAVTDIDLSHYKIRYSPALAGATWSSAIDLIAKVGRPATSCTAPAMAGTYLIKAVDKTGNLSATAASAITNISTIQGLNFVESIAEGPTAWAGTFSDTKYYPGLGGAEGIGLFGAASPLLTRTGDNLLTRSADKLSSISDSVFVSAGTYDVDGYIDLSDIYTVRATGQIDAVGYDSAATVTPITRADAHLLTRTGDRLIGRDPLSAAEGSWNINLQIALTDDDPSASPTWGAWQDFLVGDYTCRAAKFRIVLTGTPPAITPIAKSVYVELDMIDRVVGFTATVGAGGATITFDPAFYAVPEIGVSVVDGAEGDAYNITNKTSSGFDISFTNAGSPVARSISGVAKAYGERAV